jgi:hypothetical protein
LVREAECACLPSKQARQSLASLEEIAMKIACRFFRPRHNTKAIGAVSSEICALSSVVEHYLHTVGVAGSKPAARTIRSYETVRD